MLTDMTHPPFQRPGEGVLGESDLIISHGLRVGGYIDLPAHKRDALPVEDHLTILLPVPDAQQRYGHLAPRAQGIRLLLPLAEPHRPGDVPQALECREWNVQGDVHTPGLLVLDDLAGLLGIGPRIVGSYPGEADLNVNAALFFLMIRRPPRSTRFPYTSV